MNRYQVYCKAEVYFASVVEAKNAKEAEAKVLEGKNYRFKFVGEHEISDGWIKENSINVSDIAKLKNR